MTEKLSKYWQEYDKRCKAYEDQGCTRSDAQAIVDAELLKEDSKQNGGD